MTDSTTNATTICDGSHLRFMRRGTWEYIDRHKGSGVVAIVAVTDDGKLILVEQLRPPVGRKVIELPAGVAGDHEGTEDEPFVDAARRELYEETGYEADVWEEMFTGATSAGLTNEEIVFFRARGLRRTGAGGGDDSEDIRVIEVPLADIASWTQQQQRERGVGVDVKVYTGAYWAAQDE